MAIAQDAFPLYRGIGYEGQQSTVDVNDVVSRTNTDESLIAFGRAVVRGSGRRECEAISDTTTAADIIGFAVRSLAEFSVTSPWQNVTNGSPNYAAGYLPNHIVSILRRGRFYALCIDGADSGEAVSVITAAGENQGRLSTGGALTLNQVKWIEDVAAGEIGEIQVDGILNTAAQTAAPGA